MPLPQVAIVGRPNVGKSSLFNWLAGRRIAIVDPTPGVTRDRLMTPVEMEGRTLDLVDTGGMGFDDQLTVQVEGQIEVALNEASVILFVVDVKSGPVPLDDEVAERLRGVDKPIILVANKCDVQELEEQTGEFHRYGFGDVLCVSAKQKRGRDELCDRILQVLPPPELEVVAERDDILHLAIVGRRNTGKSTFINCLARSPRTIVSEIEGTTRDSVDVRIERDGKTILAIDTAGVRFKGKIKSDVEFYSLARAERSIRRADVVLHFFDSAKTVSHVDKQLAGYILEQYKPAIFVVNKWDLMEGLSTGEFGDYLRKTFPSLDHVPMAFITAKDNRNVDRVLHLARNMNKQAGARVGTGLINRLVQEALKLQTPPIRFNRQPRVYYATQTAIYPPTIVLFTNGPELFDKTYLRYILSYLRDHTVFKDVSIKLLLRNKTRTARDLATYGETKLKVKPPTSRSKHRPVGELWND